jgi:hypothetical protein
MKKLSAAVKKELNAFERNSRIQTMTLADAGEATPAVAQSTEAFSTFSKVGGGKRVPPSVFVSRKSQGNF